MFSPLSEVPAIGRNPAYAISGFLFVILCIPTSLVNNFPGLMVLRFLLGFMAGPCWRLLQGHLGPCAVLLLHRVLGHVGYRWSSHGPNHDFVCC